MWKKPKQHVLVIANTIDEEFDYLMFLLKDMDFFNQYGYEVALPDHPFFLNISKNPSLLKSLNLEEVKNIFKKEIYDPTFFEKGIKKINENIELIEKAIQRMKKLKKWKFKIFKKYKVKLTAFGAGGSYIFQCGIVLITLNEKGEFYQNPWNTIIHEIVHIGIEKSLVNKFKLTHTETETIVDAICANYLGDMLIDYKLEGLSDKKLFNLINKDNLMELPRIIKEYKKLKI